MDPGSLNCTSQCFCKRERFTFKLLIRIGNVFNAFLQKYILKWMIKHFIVLILKCSLYYTSSLYLFVLLLLFFYFFFYFVTFTYFIYSHPILFFRHGAKRVKKMGLNPFFNLSCALLLSLIRVVCPPLSSLCWD